MAHSVFLGRIRQIGLDAATNYSIQSTSAYDNQDPAGTPASLPANENLFYDVDLDTTVPPGANFEHEGLLFTFERSCFRFWGAVPKITFTFDEDPLNTSAVEMWVFDGTNWTLRHRILLNDPWRGTRSGRAKFWDFRLTSSLQGITKVWITTAPAFGYTVTTAFTAAHLFGACHDRIETPGDCHDTPDIDCIDEGPCETDESCLVPPLDCSNYAPSVCDTPPFDWPTIPPDAGGPPRPSDPPDQPLVDLCDPDALQAFKDSMTPEQLAYFEELLAHTELPCLDPDTKDPPQVLPINDPQVLPRQPIEPYVNPKTGEIEDDPRNPQPQDATRMERGFRTIVTFAGDDYTKAASFAGVNVPALLTVDPTPTIAPFHYGPALGSSVVGTLANPLAYGLNVNLTHLPSQCRVGLRVRAFRYNTSAMATVSPPLFPVLIMDCVGSANGVTGIRHIADPIPAAPNFVDFETTWADNLSAGLTLTPANARIINQGYFEFSFRGSHRVITDGHSGSIVLKMPRLNPTTQNDAIDHTSTTKPRSAFGRDLRGYCRFANIFHDPAAIERDIWLPDSSLADVAADGAPGGRFEGVQQVCFVIDVVVRVKSLADALSVQDVECALTTTGLTGTQVSESCPP